MAISGLTGPMVPWREAPVHVLTHGQHYGSCVFEGERIYNGVMFKSRDQAVGLRRSAELLGFDIPYGIWPLGHGDGRVEFKSRPDEGGGVDEHQP